MSFQEDPQVEFRLGPRLQGSLDQSGSATVSVRWDERGGGGASQSGQDSYRTGPDGLEVYRMLKRPTKAETPRECIAIHLTRMAGPAALLPCSEERLLADVSPESDPEMNSYTTPT